MSSTRPVARSGSPIRSTTEPTLAAHPDHPDETGLDAALEVACGWLGDVPGVHVVEPAVDGDRAYVRIVVDGEVDAYLRVLPSTLFGVPVRFQHRGEPGERR